MILNVAPFSFLDFQKFWRYFCTESGEMKLGFRTTLWTFLTSAGNTYENTNNLVVGNFSSIYFKRFLKNIWHIAIAWIEANRLSTIRGNYALFEI